LGRVKEIEGPVGRSRRASALRILFVAHFTLLLGLPASAMAVSTAEVVNGQLLRVTDDPAVLETNHTITVSLSAGAFTVSDTAGVIAGPGCVQAGATSATCLDTGITSTEINGDDGRETLLGSPIADRINGRAGRDNIDGRDGDDIIDSGLAAPSFDQVIGGAGFDTITYASRTARVTVDLRRNTATDADGSVDSITANVEGVVGGQAGDEIVGGRGNDVLNGGPGTVPDVLCGGLGNDTVEYSDKTQPVTVTLDGVLPTDPDIILTGIPGAAARQDCRPVRKDVPGGPPDPDNPARDCTANDGVAGEGDCVGEDTENVVGTPFDDVLTGNDTDPLYGQGPRVEPTGENRLEGGGGDDLLDGGTGPDVLDGGTGVDTVTYALRAEGVAASIDAAANDGSSLDFNSRSLNSDQVEPDVENIIGGAGGDVLEGDASDNQLNGGPGGDVLQGQGGRDRLDGGDGGDSLEGGEHGDVLDGGPGDDLLNGGFGNDAIEGGDGTDTADWSDATTPVTVLPNGLADDGRFHEGDNVGATVEGLIGGTDDDVLVANAGSGTISGGEGNDELDGDLGADLLIGGAGIDTVVYGGHPGPVSVNLAIGGGDGMADENDSVSGDVEGIAGSAANDVLSGDGKDNIINGGRGNDRISGAEGADFLAGDLGNDTLNGDVGDDTLDGAEGNDTLNGTGGKDTLKGYTGNDLLDGGTGSDRMLGNLGVDTVSYASRRGAVTVDTRGTPNDGERRENDLVAPDIESVRTGSGNDTISIRDGAAGTATCGGGRDTVSADALDEVGSGCEAENVRQTGICVPASRSVRMSGSGVVSVRMRCALAARGTMRLESAGRVRSGKGKARKLNLGRKSFRGRAGQRLTVRVKLSGAGRSLIKRRKSLRVRAVLRVRRNVAKAAMRTSTNTFTVKASGKRGSRR